MKNLKPLILATLLCLLASPVVSRAQQPNITSEIVLIELAFNGDLKNVEKLVAAGVPVDGVNEDNTTALMWSAFNGHTAVVEYLLKAGATVDMKDINGRTALMYASSGPYAETVRLLLKNGADVNTQGTAEGFTALMMAASEGQLEVVRLLLAAGAIVDTIDRDGDTATKFAREKGHAAVLELLENPPPKSDQP